MVEKRVFKPNTVVVGFTGFLKVHGHGQTHSHNLCSF